MTAALTTPAEVRDTTAWRRVFRHCVLVPLVVTAPVLGLALGSDHRYNVYWHGATVQAHPWRLVTENLRTIPMYLGFGNFRPLGRMLEWTVDLAAYVFAEVTHLPGAGRPAPGAGAGRGRAHRRLRAAGRGRHRSRTALRRAAGARGGAAALRGRRRPHRRRPDEHHHPVRRSLLPERRALVLAVAAWVCQGPRIGALVVLTGAGLAVFNEMAAVALPLATVALLIRARLVRRDQPAARGAALDRFPAGLRAGAGGALGGLPFR